MKMISYGHCCRQLLRKLGNTVSGVNPNKNSELTHPQYLGSYYIERKLCSYQDKEELKIDYEAIVNNDKDLENKLKVIILEAEVMRQEGKAVPPISFFSTEQWKDTLSLSSRSARQRYFEFLFKLSKKAENRLAKKEKKRLEWEEFQKIKSQEPKTNETFEEFALKHDLQHNNILLRIYDTTINQMYNNRLIQAIMYGQKLVVDCGYEGNMSKRENLNCAKQLMLLFSENRLHDDPFDLHLCNADQQGDIMKQLNKFIPTLYETWFPLNVHPCSYLDLFPKNQLVYLTPHCREELHEFDHDTVYIIGGIVDKVNNEPVSLAKAKREGLKMAKLPLDRYLQWGSGSGKSLTLNQVTSILLDVKLTGKWENALRHVPRRKLVDFNMAGNMRVASGTLRYDRQHTGYDRQPMRYDRQPARYDQQTTKHEQPMRKWIPSANIKLSNLSYNRSDRKVEDKEKERLTNVKTIMNE